MTIYDRFGIKTLINAAGPKTRLGGIRMAPEVLRAMEEAADSSVDMAYLQAAAGRVIAAHTGAEAGYVTSGAAAGLTLGAAACITGLDAAIIDRLPFTDGVPNEIVIPRSHRNSYDHAWRAAGARLVEVGLDDRTAGSGVRSLDPWELEAAISERTVAVAYVANRRDGPPLREIAAVAHNYGLPVLVDAAAQLPPVENLRAFIDAGADLVSFSGGKAIGGPQGTGVLCGRRDLIQAALLNHLDMDMYAAHWSPPPDLFPGVKTLHLPRHGIGRGFKVSKENVIGLLVALQRFVDGAWREDLNARQEMVRELLEAASGHGLVAPELNTVNGEPRLALRFEPTELAAQVLHRLEEGEPAIAVDPNDLAGGCLVVNPVGLDREEGRIVAARLSDVLTSLSEGMPAKRAML
ncbi:MAG: aminotransferase class V-fold PLP-dependent enzyme [Trueperaceae bacterium]